LSEQREPRLAGRRQVDISAFDGPLTPEERRRLIAEKFPSTQTLNWERAFSNNIELLGRILQDILKVDVAPTGRPGPRPSLDRTTAEPELERLLGKDPSAHPYTILPFPEAFRLLVKGRSIRHLENKLGVSKSQLHRWLAGAVVPTSDQMERVAMVFEKHPSYFPEYRAARIAGIVGDQLANDPDASIRIYERISQAVKR
jgi:transcriptional regulator with XRE-family HTH domain